MKQALMFASVCALALAACSGVDQQASDLPSAPGLQAAPPSSQSCDWKGAGTYAKNYFSVRDDKQLAASYLSDAEKAPPGSSARNDLLFNVFKLVETARDLGNVTSGGQAQGANLVATLVKPYPGGTPCGSFTVSHNDNKLADVLTEALTNGAFAFRDAANTPADFAATADGGAALWTPDWNAWIGGRSMVFGASWSATFGTELPVGNFSYRFGLIVDLGNGPKKIFGDDIAVVELCEAGINYAADLRNRLGRVSGTTGRTVLQVAGTQGIPGFCDDPQASSGGVLSRALRGVISFFAPTPLQARRRAPPGMSGSIDDLSDFLGVNPEAVILSYQTPPTSGQVTATFTVEILALTKKLNKFEDVPIILSVANNQGTPAGATLSTCDAPLVEVLSVTMRTDESGVAAFCVKVNKPGGYRLQAQHGLPAGDTETPGFAPVTITSDLFNRTP